MQVELKCSDDEKRISNGLLYVKEFDKLKLVFDLVENSDFEQSELGCVDYDVVLKLVIKEIDCLKDCLKEKEYDVESVKIQCNRFKDDVKKREIELENLYKELRKLEDRNVDVVEKNRELEERL